MGRMMDGGQFAPPEQAEFDRLKKLVVDIVPDADQLKGYVTSKGTIQFSLDNPLPAKLVQDIIIFRLKDIG